MGDAALVAGIVSITTALIGVVGNRILKRTPEAKTPEQVAIETMNAVAQQLESERENFQEQLEGERQERKDQVRELSESIDNLKKDVERLWNNTVHLKRHVITLEDALRCAGAQIPPRPVEVQELF